MSELKALIFDVDGTLADTERDGHRVAFNKAFEEAGLNWEWDVETYGKLLAVTGGKERIRFYMKDFLNGYQPPGDEIEFVKGLHKAKTRFYVQLLSEGAIPLRPGVERLLNEAREAGYRLAIATTTTPENVTALLKATLGEKSIYWFEVIAAGDIVPQKKPASDIYDYTLEKMKLNADECLAFEDSENGILSSQAANLKTIITVNGYTKAHDFTGAAIVLDHMGEPDNICEVLAGEPSIACYLTVAGLEKIFHSV